MTHTEIELKRAGLVPGAVITAEMVEAIAKVMDARDAQAQQYAELAVSRQELLDAVHIAIALPQEQDDKFSTADKLIFEVSTLKERADMLEWVTGCPILGRDEKPGMRTTKPQRESLAWELMENSGIGFYCLAHTQMTNRRKKVEKAQALLDNPGYPRIG